MNITPKTQLTFEIISSDSIQYNCNRVSCRNIIPPSYCTHFEVHMELHIVIFFFFCNQIFQRIKTIIASKVHAATMSVIVVCHASHVCNCDKEQSETYKNVPEKKQKQEINGSTHKITILNTRYQDTANKCKPL
jgi:hypothetical protein